MLLNSSELADSDGKAFSTFLEKVVDRSLEFSPTSEECSRIAFSVNDEISKEVSRHVVSLGISNIRVMRKIEGIARQLKDALKNYHAQVFARTLQSAVVLSWAFLQPTVAPSLEYLTTKKTRGLFGLSEEKEWTTDEAAWNTLLDAYGYLWTDEFDLIILKCVQRGYFDNETLSNHPKLLHYEIVAGRAVGFMDAALKLFYGSFITEEAEVLEAIEEEFHRQVQYVNLNTLCIIVQLFKDLDQPSRASNLIQHYVTHKEQPKEDWNVAIAPFGVAGLDDEIRQALDIKYSSFPTEAPNTTELLRALIAAKGFDAAATSALAITPVDEYYNSFRSAGDISLMLETIFSFRRIVNPNLEMIEVMDRATRALERIGQESRLNKLRVARYGIQVDVPGALAGGSRGA